MSAVNWIFLIVAYLSLFCLGAVDNARGPIYPDLLQTFGLDNSLGSLFFSLSSLSALIVSMASGVWMRRLGPYRGLQLFLGVQAMGAILIATAQSYPPALFGSALIGGSMGGLGVAQNVLVGAGAPTAWRRQAYAGLHCMYGLASLLVPLLVSGLYSGGFGWNSVYFVLAVFPLILLLFSIGRGSGRPVTAQGPVEALKNEKAPRLAAIVVGLMTSLYVVAEIVISSRMALFARSEAGLSAVEANNLLSLFFLLLLAGRLLFVIVRFPFSNRSILTVSLLASFVSFVIGIHVHPIGLAICGLLMAPIFPCALSLISDEFGRHADFATAWLITLNSTCLIVMHSLFGWLADTFGLHIALWTGPVALILSLSLLLGREYPPLRRYLGMTRL